MHGAWAPGGLHAFLGAVGERELNLRIRMLGGSQVGYARMTRRWFERSATAWPSRTCKTAAREITILHEGTEVARHERLRGRFSVCARLEHYLELLRRKPGALAGSLALHQEREAGRWPETFDCLWRAALERRHGASEAARQMVEVLVLCREAGAARVELAARGALAAGALEGGAVAVLARQNDRSTPEALSGLPDRLAATSREEPDLSGYDALLGGSR